MVGWESTRVRTISTSPYFIPPRDLRGLVSNIIELSRSRIFSPYISSSMGL